MSDSLRWREVCGQSRSITFDVTNCCVTAATVPRSPIDDYLLNGRDILLLGTEEDLRDHPALGRLILLGVVSGAEAYFKQIISRCVKHCSTCRNSAAKHVIPFAAVEYYGGDDVATALVESISFATAGEIVNKTKKFTGIDMKGAELTEAVRIFDRICQLRHAAVHANGVLSAANAREIGDGRAKRLRVRIDFASVQTIAAACNNLIREYNRELFFHLVTRWFKEKRLSGDWQQDRSQYTPIFTAFYSVVDEVGPNNAYNSYRALRPTLLRFIAS